MKILIFNWKDITNPWAGGAELSIHEQAKRWVNNGHEITLLTSRYKGASRKEQIDGINVIRGWGRYTVYIFVFFYYLFYLRG